MQQIEVQCSKNYFKLSLSQESGTFENNIEKKCKKPHPKLKRYTKHLQRIFALLIIQCDLVVFCSDV